MKKINYGRVKKDILKGEIGYDLWRIIQKIEYQLNPFKIHIVY